MKKIAFLSVAMLSLLSGAELYGFAYLAKLCGKQNTQIAITNQSDTDCQVKILSLEQGKTDPVKKTLIQKGETFTTTLTSPLSQYSTRMFVNNYSGDLGTLIDSTKETHIVLQGSYGCLLCVTQAGEIFYIHLKSTEEWKSAGKIIDVNDNECKK